MEIHDPHAFAVRNLDECETAAHVDGLVPVLSTKDDQWFVINMLSGESQKLEDLDSDDLSVVQEAIATHRFSRLLLSHCHQVRESGDVADKARCLLARVDYARHFGDQAVEEAERAAVTRGFTAEDIGRAYTFMDSQNPLADVPITRLSDLQAGEA